MTIALTWKLLLLEINHLEKCSRASPSLIITHDRLKFESVFIVTRSNDVSQRKTTDPFCCTSINFELLI